MFNSCNSIHTVYQDITLLLICCVVIVCIMSRLKDELFELLHV